jgi:hypothetical protein
MRPIHGGNHILLSDTKLRKLLAHFRCTTPLKWPKDDARPIRADIEVLDSREAGDHRFRESELVLDSHLGQHDSLH